MEFSGPPGIPDTGILEGATGLPTDGILFIQTEASVADSISPEVCPDGGGRICVATGAFPTDDRTKVEVFDGVNYTLCYSGVIGQGEWCTSEDGTTLEFVLPPMPVGGPYDLVFTVEGGSTVILADCLTYYHRAFRTNLFSMRAVFGDPRNVGPRTVKDSD